MHQLIACSLPCFFLSAPLTMAGDAKMGIADTAGGPRNGGSWEFSLSVGAAQRGIGELSTNAGYRSSGLTIPSFVGGASGAQPQIGFTFDNVDREYLDGYVRVDAGTTATGTTANWGYDNAIQLGSDGLLAFSATGFRSTFVQSLNAAASGPSSNHGSVPSASDSPPALISQKPTVRSRFPVSPAPRPARTSGPITPICSRWTGCRFPARLTRGPARLPVSEFQPNTCCGMPIRCSSVRKPPCSRTQCRDPSISVSSA